MADRPILFSAPMVRALLAGTKTQTRRAIKSIDGHRAITEFGPSDTLGYDWHFRDKELRWCDVRHDILIARLRCKLGDQLWVREAWNIEWVKDLAPGETLGRTRAECEAVNGGFACPCGDGIVYAATNAQRHPEHGSARWRSPIHMPRWASRITLTVTDVRVQRLQDISTGDADAEGALAPPYSSEFAAVHAVPMYQAIWEGINGPGSWDANPWVAAYTFTVQLGNIDRVQT